MASHNRSNQSSLPRKANNALVPWDNNRVERLNKRLRRKVTTFASMQIAVRAIVSRSQHSGKWICIARSRATYGPADGRKLDRVIASRLAWGRLSAGRA